MAKKLKDIIQSSDDLFEIEVTKNDKHNKETWVFKMIDPRWKGGSLKGKKFKTVYLRRGNYFFMAYKTDDSFNYFVDEKRALFRNTIEKYINCQIQYQVHSNDISVTKNMPSFKITRGEMQNKGINNFLDLCYYYKDYTAIGTGYTRDLRNLIVMDIDVDCTKQENIQEINNLLLKFASLKSLPDFYIFNNESKHIQLQWLIQNYNYKDIDYDVINKMKKDLEDDPDKNREIGWTKADFTKISEPGMTYRRFTRGLCEIVEGRRKFGDKNYTFWKAKNPMSALCGTCGLELKMPYYENGEIKFLSNDEMNNIFTDANSRRKYSECAPTFNDVKEKMSSLMEEMMSKVKENNIRKVEDDEDLSTSSKKEKNSKKNMGQSRNTFVLNCTSTTTWEQAKEMGFRKSDDIKKLPNNEMNKFRRKVFKQVKKKYKEEDKRYNGIWPDTTNLSDYGESEFEHTFESSFMHAIITFKNTSYSEDERTRSQASRHLKKNSKLLVVDSVWCENKNLSRDALFDMVNDQLEKPLSYGSFKRYLGEAKKLTDEERQILYNNYDNELKERKKKWQNAVEEKKSPEIINGLKKRYEYLLI